MSDSSLENYPPHHLISDCRRKFGHPPRQIAAEDWKKNLAIDCPSWLRKPDGLRRFFPLQRNLVEDGFIVWGYIVSCQQHLRKKSSKGGTVDILYCLGANAEPQELQLIAINHIMTSEKMRKAEEANSQKSESEKEEAMDKCLRDYCTSPIAVAFEKNGKGAHGSELTGGSLFGAPVDANVDELGSCYISSVYVNPDHLPQKALSQNFVPVIVSPYQPRVAMILPACFWPDKLIAWWTPSQEAQISNDAKEALAAIQILMTSMASYKAFLFLVYSATLGLLLFIVLFLALGFMGVLPAGKEARTPIIQSVSGGILLVIFLLTYFNCLPHTKRPVLIPLPEWALAAGLCAGSLISLLALRSSMQGIYDQLIASVIALFSVAYFLVRLRYFSVITWKTIVIATIPPALWLLRSWI